ncbi:MAG: hypothetical protein A3C47_00975 [Omnitrophica bacterium RIFCSPHIGHO2_02_FULL_51_18]|nr:MAG: hypothetical protein A3C47_00975 [Omnitrophica bacterium RIFCSPHIGHO2_02_FULL_51_18]
MIEKTSRKTLFFFLFLFSLTLHSLGSGNLPLLDRDEPRFSEGSREMLERGDFLVPRFNNQERYDKPPLFYWCQAASYRLFGENDFAARFPSSLAAALTALLVFGFGARLAGKKTGFWAAALFTLSIQTLILARAATADMVLTLFYTLAVWSAWELLAKRSFFWWLSFYTALSLGFLAKGPIAFLPLLSVYIFMRAKGIQDFFTKFLPFPGILLSLFLIALWAVPAFRETHGEYFRLGIGKHVIERSFHPLENHGAKSFLGYAATLPFYLVTLFLSFFPWSMHLPRAAGLLKKHPSAEHAYLWFQTAPVFLLFSLLRTKLPHYTFPAFPLLSLLLAGLWFKENLSTRRLARASVVMTLLTLVLSMAVFPRLSFTSPSRRLAQESAQYLKPDMPFASVDYNEPSLVWYFRKYLRTWHTGLNKEKAPAFMEEAGPRVCVMPSNSLAKIFSAVPAGWKTVSVNGFNAAKGKPARLTALIKPD